MSKLKFVYRLFSKQFQTIQIDYPVDPKPRQKIQILNDHLISQKPNYKKLLAELLTLTPKIHQIQKQDQTTNKELPGWNNGFLPGLDIIALYGMIHLFKPKQYIEIGSGNSTKVVRKAIRAQQLETHITSIDPVPRAEIDKLADEIIRKPLEDIPGIGNQIAEKLNSGDILFIDNSHRVFPNSDAMVCFLEILPLLKTGVIVHFHDIYLPYDYPQFMCDRYYNEQYLLASFLISNPARYQTLLPNYFVSEDQELSSTISSIWNHPNLDGVERHGGSYWIKIN